MTVAILYREELKEYDFGEGHPFRGGRYRTFPRFLRESLAEDNNYRILKSGWADDEDLLSICSKDYIDFTRQYYSAAASGLSVSERGFYQYHSMDNKPAGRPGKLEEAARLIIGQVKHACDLVQAGVYKHAVSIGGGLHHAKRSFGEGFCLYNDVAFCGIYLKEKYNLERVLILDTDAHAGNGTCEYFYSDPKVLFIDIHQDPRTLYPGTGFASEIGDGEGKGFTINIPMPIYAGDDSYRLVFEEIVHPVAQEFKPQIIIRNGGSDPHFSDGLTNLGLTVAGFRTIGEQTRKMAEVCEGKLIELIASGYNEKVLPHSWLALIAGSAGFDVSIEEPEPIPQMFRDDIALPQTEQVVAEVKRYLVDYWQCFAQ